MALTPDERNKVWKGIMRWWSQRREATGGISKSDLFAAIEATDDWIDANQASFNQALPEAFRTGATQAMKTMLFCIIAIARVSIPFLREVFGEVD